VTDEGRVETTVPLRSCDLLESNPVPTPLTATASCVMTISVETSSTDSGQWRLAAVCRGERSDLFFSPAGEGRRAAREREEIAKRLCAHCPVIARCREVALESAEPYGVWGGLTARERRQVRRAV
jgi:WhiB family redox-sensing transcriptional regulator